MSILNIISVKITRGILLNIILLIISTSIYAQEEVSLPEVIPPSPTAQSFQKFGDIPANLTSGLPNMSVPLFTINCGDITIPIEVKYLSSGLKPAEETGIIGLGWSLNIGGSLSRNIVGAPDEVYWDQTIPRDADFVGSTDVNEQDDANFTYLYDVTDKKNDSEYDIFSYSLINKTGTFIFERSTNKDVFLTPVQLNYKPVKIIAQDDLEYFEIIDDDGTLYRFGKSIETDEYEREFYSDDGFTGDAGVHGTTTWLLTDIVSANGHDVVTFEYQDVYYIDLSDTKTTNIRKISYSNNWRFKIAQRSSGGGCFLDESYFDDSGYTGYQYTNKVLSEINFNGRKVTFNYNSDTYPDNQLDWIKLFDENDNLIKYIDFEQSLYDVNTSHLQRYKLDQIKFINPVNMADFFDYSFIYFTGAFPTINNDYSKETYAIDYWGYYNGANSNDNLMSDDYVPDVGVPYFEPTADRSINFEELKTGVLKQINYPTGGYSEFEYEQNTVVSGLRIANIKTFDGLNKQTTRSYVYGSSLFPFGPHAFDCHNYSALYRDCGAGGDISWTVFSNYTSNNLIDQTPYKGMPIVYQQVTEYYGANDNNMGKIEHHFDLTPVDYSYEQDYECCVSPPFDIIWGPYIDESYYQSNYNYGDVFEDQTYYYENDGSGYSMVKSIDRTYNHETLDPVYGLKIQKRISVDGGWPKLKVCHFRIMDYYYTPVKQYLESETITEDGVTVVNNYLYNSKNLVKKVETTNSKGEVITKHFVYPSDCSSTTEEFVVEMIGANILNKPIETYTLKDNQYVTGGSHTTYKTGTDVGLVDKVYSLNKVEGLEISPLAGQFEPSNYQGQYRLDDNYRLVYTADAYDQGNILQYHKEDNIDVSYIWGYNNTYPIAKVVNASYSEIIHDGFEEQGYCGSTGVIGKYGCIEGSPIVYSVSPGAYILRYWVSSNPANPSSWKLKQVTYPAGTTSISISGGAEGYNIDEVFIVPASAQMITYTYEPLIGITSVTDERNRTTTYEYDDFGRLEEVKDHEDNVLEHHNYHYAE